MEPAGAGLHLRMPLGTAIAAMSMRLTKLVKRPRLPFLAQVTTGACFSSASISAQPIRPHQDNAIQT